MPHPTENEWSLAKKLLTLFLISYLFLYNFPFPFNQIPVIDNLTNFYSNTLEQLTLLLGTHVLKIPALHKVELTGSGDTTFDYAYLLTLLVLSLLLTFIVFAFTRLQKNYEPLFSWLIVYLRYSLGFTMLLYGFAKIYDGQFAPLTLNRLQQTYGNSSPMGLLWTFMGYSKPYTVFVGMAEIMAGLLLFFRKTKTIGGLVTLGIMLNVVMLNFCYDVPVKLFSLHLTLMTFVILLPDLKALLRFFILQQPATLTVVALSFPHQWMRTSRLLIKLLIIVVLPAIIITREITELNKSTPDNNSSSPQGINTTNPAAANSDSLTILQKNKTVKDYPLMNRGFHWINEYPYNQ